MSESSPAATVGGVTIEVHPVPTDDEAVALAAAIEALWPKPVATNTRRRPSTLDWRFSGRWWKRDRMSSAGRPWR